MQENKEIAAKINHDITDVEELLIALGDKKRLELLKHLINAYQDNPLCVKDLAERTELSRPAVSHHLKILKSAGIVDFKKNGTQSYYYLNHVQDNAARMKQLTDDLIKITC